MTTRKWWQRTFSALKRASATRKRSARRRSTCLHVEMLEERMVPTTWTVNTTNATGAGSLFNAVTKSDIDTTSPVVINFDPTVFTSATTLTLASTLTFNNKTLPVTLTGPTNVAITISGGGSIEDVSVQGSSGLSISNLTLTQGNGSNGGALSISGGTVSINDCTINNSSATSGGGGIYMSGGSVLVENSIIQGNTAPGSGGGISASGGTLTVLNSTIENNQAGGGGGGIYIDSVALLENSTIQNNTSQGSGGGGIYVYQDSDFTVISCTINANVETQAGGGGLYLNVLYAFVTATIVNSTITNNSAPTGSGGGLYALGSYALGYNGSFNVVNCTLTGNVAGSGDGGGMWLEYQNANLVNDIVWNNSAPSGPDIYDITGYTINFSLLGSTSGANVPASAVGVFPVSNSSTSVLSASGLGSNGGPTQTIPLATASLASSDAGSVSTVSSAVSNNGTTVQLKTAGVFSAFSLPTLATGFYFVIQIDNEQLAVVGVTEKGSTESLTVVRGANGTTAAPHAVNAPVYLVSDQRSYMTPLLDLASGATPDMGAVQSTGEVAPAVLSFGTQPSSTSVGSSLGAVSVSDLSGTTPVAGATVTLALSTGTLGGTTTATTTAAGIATFSNLTVSAAGTYTLSASASGATGGTSSSFIITAAVPPALTFTVEPAGTMAGSTLAPVTVVDMSGGTPQTGVSVILAISNNTLSGTTTAVTDATGSAIFSNLSIAAAGSYTLSATAAGATTATSSSFVITAAPLPTAQFSTGSETVNESAGTFSITVNLSAASAQAVTVPFTLSGTAVNGIDYSGVAASLTIPAGSTTALVTGTLLSDPGASQTLIFTLGTPTNANLGTTTVNTLTITEPAPTVQFSTASETVSASAGSFSITVSLSAASTQAVTVPFTLSGTAVSGTDYSGVAPGSLTLTIPAGQNSATITGTLLADPGANQTLIVTLGAPTNATPGTNTVNTLTIAESTPTVQFSTASEIVDASAGTFSITVSLSAASNQAVTVPYTLSGTAQSGIDYKVNANPLVIPAGSTSATIAGELFADPGMSQTLILTLNTPTNATVGNTAVNTLTITEPVPTVQFSSAGEAVNESAGTFSITVSLATASTQAVSVPFTLGGTAVSGIDYSGVTPSPLSIPAGSTSAIITGTLLSDPGANPTLTVTLGTPTNATLGATTVNTLTITEPAPTVQFSAGSETINAPGTFSITVSLAAASTQEVIVPFTLSGTAKSGTDTSGVTASPLVIPAGSTTATITGTLLADPGVSQTLIVTLGTPTNATLGNTTVNTLTITEPMPAVQFSTAGETVNESAGTFSITVSLSTASTQAVTVPFTLSGTAKNGIDYSGVTVGPMSIPAGSISAAITGTLLADPGLSQTLIVTLGAPTNATLGTNTVNTLTITEPKPAVQFNTAVETVAESAGTFSITVSLSAASTQAVTVPFTLGGTARNGIDTSGVTASPVSIPAGSISAIITGTLLSDAGASQTLIVTLGAPANATLGTTTVNTLTITEPAYGNPAILSFNREPSNGVAGTSINPPVIVLVTDAKGNDVPGITVTVAGASGPAQFGTYTAITSAAGQAVFSNLVEDTAGAYTLSASGAGLSATSTPFVISAASPTSLLFVNQPGTTVAGSVIGPVTAQALDAFGNPVPNVAIGMALGGGSFSSGTTRMVTNTQGEAVFGNLVTTKVGTYTLDMSAAGVAGVSSDSFDVMMAGATLSFAVQPVNATDGVMMRTVVVRIADRYGNVGSGLAVNLSLSSGALIGSTTAITDGTGQASFGGLSIMPAGTGYTLTASASGLRSVRSNTFNILALRGTSLAFTNQPTDATAGSNLGPVTLTLLDTNSNPVAGVPVTISVSSSGRLVGTIGVVTDLSGDAVFSNLSEGRVGSFTLKATAQGMSTISDSFTITAGAAAKLTFLTQPVNASAGSTIRAVSVLATDSYGNIAADNTVDIGLLYGSLSNGTLSITGDDTGKAAFVDLTEDTVGTYTLVATSGPATAYSRPFVIKAAAVSQLVFLTQPGNGKAGAALSPFIVQALDSFGNVVTSACTPIRISDGTLSKGPYITTRGQAVIANWMETIAGTDTLTASAAAGEISVESDSFTVAPGAGKLSFVNQPSKTTADGDIGPVALRLTDRLGNGLPDVPVTLGITPGTLANGTETLTTDDTGEVIFDPLNETRVGTYTLVATAAGGGSVKSGRFVVTAGAAFTLTFTTQPRNINAGNELGPLTAQLYDEYGNVVTTAGTRVTLSISSGTLRGATTAVTNGLGRATFNALFETVAGTYTLQASSGYVSATSQTFVVMPNLASHVTFVAQPAGASVGGNLGMVTVEVDDAYGNAIANQLVIVSLNSRTVLNGVKAALTDAWGDATFNSLSVNGIGRFTLTASVDGRGAASSPFTITAN